MNGARTLRAVGMAGKDGRPTKSLLNRYCRQHRLLNKATAGNSASGFSARHRPHNKRPQMTGLAANNQPQMTSASRRAGKWGECRGTCSHEGGCRPTYTVPTPPNAFACHCPYPLP